jgi:excisionase family DNA binding protein
MKTMTKTEHGYPGPRIRSRREAAQILGISLRTLERLAEAGKIKITKTSTRGRGVSDAEIERHAKEGVAEVAGA